MASDKFLRVHVAGPDTMSASTLIVFLLAAACATAQIFRLPEREACENSEYTTQLTFLVQSMDV